MTTALQLFQDELRAWSYAQFQRAHPKGAIAHLRSEADELLADPFNLEEYADAFMLLLDAAATAGFAIEDLLGASYLKLAKNRRRTWGPTNEQGFSQHVEPTQPQSPRPAPVREPAASRALDLVANERTTQDSKWGGPGHDDEHDTEDWRDILDEHVAKLRTATDVYLGMATRGRDVGQEEYIRRLTQVAAVALAWLEARLRYIDYRDEHEYHLRAQGTVGTTQRRAGGGIPCVRDVS